MTRLLVREKNNLKKVEVVSFALLMLLALWLRWQNLGYYPVNEDEFMSFSAVKGILSSGLPRIGENEEIYWRALLPHYLMAIPLFLTEATVTAARIIPTLFSVFVLPVAYLGGRILSGRIAGWVAAIFLAFSNYQNYHAAFARFYIPFQFFFLATALLAGSYFILGRQKHGPWLLAATLATLASHALSVCVLPLLVLAFVCGQHWYLLRSKAFWFSTVAVALFTWGLIFWRPEEIFVNTLSVRLLVGGLANKLAFYEVFRTYVPFGWGVIILGALPVLWSKSRLWIYLWCGFLGEMVFISLVAPDPNVRYMSHLFAYGVVLAAASLCWPVKELLLNGRNAFSGCGLKTKFFSCAIILAAFVHLILADRVAEHAAFGKTLSSRDQKPAHQFIARMMGPGDVVISMEPGMSGYFLGRPVNYWLRERFDSETRSFSSYPAKVKQDNPEYYIDSPERMQEVLSATTARVWVYLNHKILITTSQAMRDLMEKNFKTVFSDGTMQTFVLVRY